MDKIATNWKVLFADKKRFILEIIKVALGLLLLVNMWLPFFRVTGGTIGQSFALDDYGWMWLLVIVIFVLWIGYPVLLLLGMGKWSWFAFLGQAAVGGLLFLILMLTFFQVETQINVNLSFGFFMFVIYLGAMFVLAFLEKPVIALVEKTFAKK